MRIIPLTRGLVATVDDEDYDALSKYNWHASADGVGKNTNYAKRMIQSNYRRSTVWMHRVILGVSESEMIDHINRNGLDNRRCNLRVATPSQNGHNRDKQSNNTSGVMGVTWSRAAKKWQAQIMIGKRMHYLGVFVNFSDAVDAREYANRAMKP